MKPNKRILAAALAFTAVATLFSITVKEFEDSTASDFDITIHTHRKPYIDIKLNNVSSLFVFDTGALLIILDSWWREVIPSSQRLPEMSLFRMWGREFSSWYVRDLSIAFTEGQGSGTIPTHRTALSEIDLAKEKYISSSFCDEARRCGGILGADAIAPIAKKIRHKSPDKLTVTPGECEAWFQTGYPMPLVIARIAEGGREVRMLVDSAMPKTRLFITDTPQEIHVPGLPEPLLAVGTSRDKRSADFPATVLNGMEFDGAIGWNDLREAEWTWIPCTGEFEFHGYLTREE